MTLEKRAQAHFPNNPRYQQAWLAMVEFLGDRWLLSKQVTRG